MAEREITQWKLCAYDFYSTIEKSFVWFDRPGSPEKDCWHRLSGVVPS